MATAPIGPIASRSTILSSVVGSVARRRADRDEGRDRRLRQNDKDERGKEVDKRHAEPLRPRDTANLESLVGHLVYSAA
jgi:hypothetical protein